jgi:hypothetical protein
MTGGSGEHPAFGARAEVSTTTTEGELGFVQSRIWEGYGHAKEKA